MVENDTDASNRVFASPFTARRSALMPHTFVIFGASGDLTQRKLMPALYQLFRKGRLPKDTRIVGFSRTEFSHDAWRTELAEIDRQARWARISTPSCGTSSRRTSIYHPGDIGHADDFTTLWPACSTSIEKVRQQHARLLPGHGAAVLRTGRRATWAAPAWPTKTAASGA